ncbi:MAG: hypothetical protein AB2660_15305 [Candidatus Thiodiazotropha sp.]
MKRLLLAGFIGLVFWGCATTYQKQGFSGGYTSIQMAENIFKVSFKGNGYTSKDRAADFALLRSAELALENGYKYFAIIDEQQHSKKSLFTTPSSSTTSINTNTYGTATGYGNYTTYSGNTYGRATTFNSGGQTFLISKPASVNTIYCFKQKPSILSYDASIIQKSIREKYDLDNNTVETATDEEMGSSSDPAAPR